MLVNKINSVKFEMFMLTSDTYFRSAILIAFANNLINIISINVLNNIYHNPYYSMNIMKIHIFIHNKVGELLMI